MSKRDTYLPSRDTRTPLRSRSVEAAKFLISASRAYVAGRAGIQKVNEAVECWKEATIPVVEAKPQKP